MASEAKSLPEAPEPLPSTLRLVVALAALSATVQREPPRPSTYLKSQHTQWLRAICKLLSIDPAHLPPTISAESIRATADDQREEWTSQEIDRIAGVLVEGSLAMEAEAAKAKKEESLKYTPMARALSYSTLENLGLPAKDLVPQAEQNLSRTLFKALKAGEDSKATVENTRAAHSQGWGGNIGRTLATGAGVVAGGILIGVTGGLAAPAIAAVLAPLGIGGLIGGAAAPVVLGTLFGVGGGGLAGKRVRERWKGVEEFSFIEVGAGTKASAEEMEDLKAARERYKARAKKGDTGLAEAPAVGGEQDPSEKGAETGTAPVEEKEEKDEVSAAEASEKSRLDLEERLLNLTLDSGGQIAPSVESSPRASLDSPRTSLDSGKDEKGIADVKKPPSLTATVVVPGLLTVSKTEAITAWRSICSPNAPSASAYAPRIATGDKAATEEASQAIDAAATATAHGLKDGRDVYLLRFETAAMLKTGRDIDLWVEGKLKGKIKSAIIKRTVLSAYFAAVSLPLTVYTVASMGLDNTWMQAQDRAAKAGRILGEVLEKRVQGERPVVLIGSSLGALTILKALLYLASLPSPPGSASPVAAYVESAFLISLPSAPTPEDWGKCRSVVARRLVNSWSDADFVLAGVVRLHEVISRAATLSNGVRVAGLGPVKQPGVEDVDVSSVLRGHMELQTKMPEVLQVIDVDA